MAVAPNNEQIVRDAYAAIGRTGTGAAPNQVDQEGLDYWTNQLNSGNLTADTFQGAFTGAVNNVLQTNPTGAVSQYVSNYLNPTPPPPPPPPPPAPPPLPSATNLAAAQSSTAKAPVQGYDAQTANLSTWNVDPATQTVEGRLQGLLASGNPVLQQARTQALQSMNARGLLNTSMAAGEGVNALIRSALPIAQQDATTLASAGQFNTQMANNMSQFNANALNSASMFKADANNAAELAYAQALNANVSQQMDAGLKTAMANADNATRVRLQEIDAQTRRDLVNVEASYRVQMQASDSAQSIFQQSVKNISDIMSNPDLDVASKQAAVNAQKDSLTNAMSILSATSGIPGLKDLITFDTNVSSTPSPTPAPTPTPAPENSGLSGE